MKKTLGVNAYIIDTGIRRTHTQFGGRAVVGFDAIGDGRNTGTTSAVIAGVDWVRANRISPAVANMSLGGGVSTALDTAVRNSIAAGVTYAIAAGNSNANAANFSPARVGEAITVGATTMSDARSSFSNFGSVVDIFAPGSSILSAWFSSNTATGMLSGTSMAAPHVAGVVCAIPAGQSDATPAQARNEIVNVATLNRLSGIPARTRPTVGSPCRVRGNLTTLS